MADVRVDEFLSATKRISERFHIDKFRAITAGCRSAFVKRERCYYYRTLIWPATNQKPRKTIGYCFENNRLYCFPKTSHYIFFGSSCIIQDNLSYLTVNNKYIISREIGIRAKVRLALPLTTWTENTMFFWYRIWWRMTNSSISKAQILSLVVLVADVWNTNKRGPPFNNRIYFTYSWKLFVECLLSFFGWKVSVQK